MDVFSLVALGGLWRVIFADGSVLDETKCTSVCTNSPGVVTYSAPAAEVVVAARKIEGGLEMRAKVTPRAGVVTDVMLPSRIVFSPDDVERVTFPGDKSMGTGYSLKDDFFRRQSDVTRCSWEELAVSGHGYKDVYGGGCTMRPLRDAPVDVSVTDEGRRFLGEKTSSSITNSRFVVNRAPLPAHRDRVIVDSPNGPLLSGCALGGKGMVWRIGTASGYDGRYTRLSLLRGCVRGVLGENRKSKRRKVAFLCLPAGPVNLGFCPTPHSDMRAMMQKLAGKDFEYAEIKSPAELRKALAGDEFLMVLNPYPETLPAESAEDFVKMLALVRGYVKGGGHWLGVGGLSFYKALVPRQWHTLGGGYPGLFADFVHWRWKDGSSTALMGVQPRPEHEPWKCPKRFVPGTMRIGADENGGWLEHGFKAWVTNGVSWKTPTVRMLKNRTLAETCDEYMAANNLSRSLKDKVRDNAKLEKLKIAPLLFLGDSSEKCRRALAHIPVPSLIHQSQYLKGGFDKQYPDHLPPRPEFGTEEEYRRFIGEARAAGHLYSPYTNPTWWCDHPRGPTFVAAGEAPLSIDEKGRPIYESYGKADGWTICFWHPAVQAANRKVRRQFTVDYPVDVLFQDQCGARRRAYDFNPAAPHPTAYLEGVISMVEEDSRIVSLGTEDGWDRVAREETLLCGLSWGTVPVHDAEQGQNVLAKVGLPAHLWEIEAVPTRLFHDTCLFYLHDLGGFAKNERVLAWCLALGYQLSFRCNAWHFTHDRKVCDWYGYLHELQGKIVSKYAGRKLVSFRHDRSPLLRRKDINPATRLDDGVICAEYDGGARVAVNLGDVPRAVNGRLLAPYGYLITVPGFEASFLEGQTPAVRQIGK
jgi:hypothetical protein